MRKFYFLGVVFVTIFYGCSNDVKSNDTFNDIDANVGKIESHLENIESNTEILLGRINDIDANVGKIESHLENIESNTEYSYHVIHKVNNYPSVVFYRINKSTGEIESRVNGFIDRWETYRD